MRLGVKEGGKEGGCWWIDGWGSDLESAHQSITLRFSKNPASRIDMAEFSLFAVYDGHGDNGEEMALLCAAEIPKRIHRKASGKKVTLQAIRYA